MVRNLLRDALVYAGVVPLTPMWVVARLERRLGRDGFFAGCSEFLALVPGLPGVFLRRSFYRMSLDRLATDCHIGFGTTLAHPGVTVGRGVYVGSRCTLGLCHLEDDVTVGSNVDLLSGRRQHDFANVATPVQQQARTFNPVRLGRNCWVGNSAVVMADVGAGAVVGAGSVVVQPVPAGAVAVGNPAAVKRVRAAA